MRSIIAFFILPIFILPSGCKRMNYREKAADPEMYRKTVKQLTDIIVHDIFSPPIASRIYAYPNIAAYEVMIHENRNFRSLAGQLNGLEPAPPPNPEKEYFFPLASVAAFMKVGQALVFSEEKFEEFRENIYKEYRKMGVPKEVFENSVSYGEWVADHILAWARKDNYNETRSFPKYTVLDEPGKWKPTPPDYMEGIEPHWNRIRTFLIDSAGQFIPPPPTPYSIDPESQFYREMMEVYETVNGLSGEQKNIANFWDCNPYVSHHQGHVMFATKKITPGGHWIGITGIATREAGLDMMKTIETYVYVSVGLADAFISCWDEKWRSVYIRPETAINQLVDEDWVPHLQTPPFPEYTSGHSVISASAAIILTGLLGEPFHYIDSVEVEYGLPPREFNSFIEASEEAAISRMYGGIHFMPSINNGITEGRSVGHYVMQHLKTRVVE